MKKPFTAIKNEMIPEEQKSDYFENWGDNKIITPRLKVRDTFQHPNQWNPFTKKKSNLGIIK